MVVKWSGVIQGTDTFAPTSLPVPSDKTIQVHGSTAGAGAHVKIRGGVEMASAATAWFYLRDVDNTELDFTVTDGSASVPGRPGGSEG